MNEDSAIKVLEISTLVLMLVCVLLASYKSGFNISPQSLFNKDQKKFKIDPSKLASYLISVSSAFLIMFFYLFIVTGDAGIALLYGILNTVFIAYALAYWLLLKKL